jgi:hypothetical protein
MRLRNAIYAAVIVSMASAAAAQTPAVLTVTSPTLKANEVVPIDHTADGRNVSPALMWSGAPANTRQFALIYDDPDVMFGNPPASFVHWVVYKIPGTAKGLPAELPMDAVLTAPPEIAGTIQGLSGFKRTGYRGPAPPPGKPHHYTRRAGAHGRRRSADRVWQDARTRCRRAGCDRCRRAAAARHDPRGAVVPAPAASPGGTAVTAARRARGTGVAPGRRPCAGRAPPRALRRVRRARLRARGSRPSACSFRGWCEVTDAPR